MIKKTPPPEFMNASRWCGVHDTPQRRLGCYSNCKTKERSSDQQKLF